MATSTGTRSASTGSTGLRHSLSRVLAAAPLPLSLTALQGLGTPTWQRHLPDRDRMYAPAPDHVADTTGSVTDHHCAGHHCAFRQQSGTRRGAAR
ncbi:hypothetical protein [Streptomyces kurssanovii]|uniref:Uncharacterized protein n=1 Tax=Streptomyces kurssanovii TaxID=67312 RepID=A0ABV3I0I8_9ACTN